MANRYKLHLVPENGATLTKRTTDEWSLGYTFKVLTSDLLSMRRGSYITIDDVNTAEHYYDSDFTITFDTQTVKAHLDELADHDFGYEQARDLLVRGQ
jgi:hypothetical protein|tara:strand:- start:206 stop:499 length:294 start_codon:yes stop_codon:yes gene_type:complete